MSSKDSPKLPQHIAIIMDGNGRWANKRALPRAAGHRTGVLTLRQTVEHCVARKINALTVYAFSSENWRRPDEEVDFLLDLFMTALNEEVSTLHQNNVKLRFIGDRSAFPQKLQETITVAEKDTEENTGLNLNIAANYGGRWDIVQAAQKLARQVEEGTLRPKDINEDLFSGQISLPDLPEPDLFIRTGGEQRVSNYLLWQLAYAELYFTDLLWPEFSFEVLNEAIDWYLGRQRRFGKTSEQVNKAS